MVVIEKFWDWFSQNDLAQWDMLEAVVAGTAFGFWVMVYRAMDQIPFFAKFRFSKDKPLPLFRPDAPNAWIPLVLYISLIRVYHWYYPKPSYGLETPTEFRIMIEVLEGIIYYDFIFFWIHLFMHKNPKLNWFFQHDIHHSQKILCANEVQHHSFIDGSLQVIVNIIVQNISLYAWFLNSNYRKHFISRLLHNKDFQT